jgi:aarF domain-containing kinase
MQTDPNWANFLYDTSAHKLGLIDFGASREYSKEFMDGWYRLLMSAVKGDRETMKIESENLGYLTGEENEVSDLALTGSFLADDVDDGESAP